MKKKCVLVTGASRGIGKACAKRFAQAGYHLFINCRHSVHELTQLSEELNADGYLCTAVAGDVGQAEEVRRMFRTISSYTED